MAKRYFVATWFNGKRSLGDLPNGVATLEEAERFVVEDRDALQRIGASAEVVIEEWDERDDGTAVPLNDAAERYAGRRGYGLDL